MTKFGSRLQCFLCAILVALFGVFIGFQITARPAAYAEDGTPIRNLTAEYFVTIHDEGKTLTVKTAETTVGEALTASGIEIAETDLVEPSLDTVVTGDFNINIHRARPAVLIDGTTRQYVMTASYDPKQIALEAGLLIYDGDEFELLINDNFLEFGAASVYQVVRNGGRTITLEETLPYETEVKYDYSLAKGETYLEQAGEDGRRISQYEVDFENNQEVARELVAEEVLLEPVPEIVVVGAELEIPAERLQCATWAREAGVAENDLEVALELIYRESTCRVDAINAYSGAYGIPQALPGEKMAQAGEDWETNPVTQIRWMISYVNGRYGGWSQAMNWWWEHGWY